MQKTNNKTDLKSKNPFLTEMADELWQRLDEGKNRVSKEDLVKRAAALKQKSRNQSTSKS
ncbi:MAG TPA: hypothetical protein VK517_10320 [Cyclobacteriaceae bacterium]|jgi:hypothetical protein|nr:hypothetical protein [Cyclobacteriaceae bacterium]